MKNKQRSKDSPAPQQLTSVIEINEACESSNSSSSRTVDSTMSSPMPAPKTPSSVAPVKLAMSEMHPSKVHQTMAPPSSGLRNGFTDIDYNKTPIQSLIHDTPSKTPAPSSEFTFRYARPGADEGLTPEARKLMASIREDAAKIKAGLAAEFAQERRESGERRKIAAAKGKSSRFSAAHMAEFKKMDSIEGHASSFRANPGRFTPVKAAAAANPVTPLKPGIKRSQSKANLDEPDSVRSKTAPPRPLARSVEKKPEAPEHPSKRLRQRMEDDASTHRPVSRDGTSIPRPKSSGHDSTRGIPRSHTMGSLMTPTKSSLARSNSTKSATISLVRSPSQPDFQKVNSFSAKVGTSLLRSPSKADLALLARSPSRKGFGGLKWGSTSNLASESSGIPTQVETPGRFGRIKSILKRQGSGAKHRSAIPQLTASPIKTPSRAGLTERMLPSVPHTTPGRKHSRHVDFTPDTKQAAMSQESPSPVKPSIPRSTALTKLQVPKFVAGGKAGVTQKSSTGEVVYPDLSAYAVDGDSTQPPESVPSTFTFRSDHTIQFEDSPSKGFGSGAGQASLRQVRKSTDPSIQIPGSFPSTSEVSPNKENKDPLIRNGIPHGMTNKKRHRASSEEEEDADDEGSKRGMKKLRKNPPAAEGHALVAPRLHSQASPTKKVPQTPASQKKKAGLSLSRLQMLAQPKIRK
ncbi:hypothetical protein ONZ43_g5648 [Nemania bipapillata]|uniref:Uncharacterized protein n=1 Tax=Nemania bipapillata TaxID=110536 RepID=A0ACC2I829_9PEZI|nr:hypothetical protein ONZ43_g5648 [Nemania bipapillata]